MPSAGRVAAGVARGVRLIGPGPATRPLGDRVKQSLFGALAERVSGAHVLDLFAGSGAAGIEALSRGAASATFVDDDPKAIAAIGANLRAAGLTSPGAIHRMDVLRYLDRAAASGERHDLVIVDPPYGDPVMLAALEVLGRGTVLTAEAIVVAKHFWRDELPETIGVLRRSRERRFGETALTFYAAQVVAGRDR